MSTTSRRILARLSYANIVSTTALVVALGTGTAYAANTVFSTDIVDGEVQHPDLAADAVAGDRIVDSTVGHGDLSADAVAGDRIADSTVGHADLGPSSVAGDRVVDGSIDLVDLSGVDARSTITVPAKTVKPGRCLTRKLDVAGARPGQLVALSPLGKLPRGVFLSTARVAIADKVDVAVCNFGAKQSKAIKALPVRIVTFD